MTIFAFLNYQTMIKITLPDGSVKEFALGVTPMDVAKSISEGFARNVISASFNGTTVETTTSLTDGSLILYTWNDENGKKLLAFDFTCHGASP
jgi:threonyl-tRNA synthetase